MLRNGSHKLKLDAYAKWYLDKVVASPATSKHVLILALLYKYFYSFLAFIIDNVSFWLNTFTFYVNTISSQNGYVVVLFNYLHTVTFSCATVMIWEINRLFEFIRSIKL